MRHFTNTKKAGALLRLCAIAGLTMPALAACSGGGVPDFINSTTKFAQSKFGKASPRVTTSRKVRKGGGRQMVGKPYQVAGRWYKPKHDPNYDKTGAASWYGPNFHGRQTANGEVFDQFAISAAHPTLPLPSYVRVTNLANNRSIMVRVNDRGPFVHGREIDLSARAAELLGYQKKGIARVRVKYVGPAPLEGDDTKMLLASYNAPTPMERGQRATPQIAVAQLERPVAAPIVQTRTTSRRSGVSNVTISPQGFNIVPPSTSGQHKPLSPHTGLTPLFFADPGNAAIMQDNFNAAFDATEQLANGSQALRDWQQGVDTDTRRVNIVLGTFSGPENVENVMQVFSVLGAVDVADIQLKTGAATQLSLSYLKPGVSRDDVIRRATALGLKPQFLYD